jgi:hypothetical protein
MVGVKLSCHSLRTLLLNKYHFGERHFAACYFAKRHSGKSHFVKCRQAECRGALILSNLPFQQIFFTIF